MTYSANNKNDVIGNVLKNTAGSLKWKLNLPRKPNYDTVYLFKETKKFFNAPCYDLETDKIPESYKGGHYEARTTLQHTESRLKYANESADKKRSDMARQWKELEKKEEQLKTNFKEFNYFLASNANKRSRAEKKYEELESQIEKRIEAIHFMEEDIKTMKTTRVDMQKNIDKYGKYETFLQLAVESSDFPNIMSMINRYLLLEETKKYDVDKMTRTSEIFNREQLMYINKVHDIQTIFMQFSMELSALRHRFDQAKDRTHLWESVLQNVCNKYNKIAGDLYWVRMAIDELFQVTYTRLKAADVSAHLDRLLHINTTIMTMELIEQKVNRLLQQRDAETSMAQMTFQTSFAQSNVTERFIDGALSDDEAMRGFGMPVSRPDINPDNMAGMWVKKIVKRETPRISDAYKRREEMLEKNFPIQLAPSNWIKAKVKNFERLYRKALVDIQREKMSRVVGGFRTIATSRDETEPSETSSRSSKLKRTRWSMAAGQLAEGHDDVGKDSEIRLPAVVPVASANVLTLLEDGEEDGLRPPTDWRNPKLPKRKAIELKFDRKADSIVKDFGDREKDKLPTIRRFSQVKETESNQFYTKKQDAYFRTYETINYKRSLGLIGVTAARRFTEETTELPQLIMKNKRRSRMD